MSSGKTATGIPNIARLLNHTVRACTHETLDACDPKRTEALAKHMIGLCVGHSHHEAIVAMAILMASIIGESETDEMMVPMVIHDIAANFVEPMEDE